MSFILIFGPQAVGKMSVGEALAEKTGYSLFHNHQTIEALLPLFPFNSEEFQSLNSMMRKEIMKALGKSKRPVIFTFVWDIDSEFEWKYISWLINTHGLVSPEKAFFVELASPINVRKERNVHQDRLDKKPSKRDIKLSTNLLETFELQGRSNTEIGEKFRYSDNHIRIDNSNLSIEETVNVILKRFPEIKTKI